MLLLIMDNNFKTPPTPPQNPSLVENPNFLPNTLETQVTSKKPRRLILFLFILLIFLILGVMGFLYLYMKPKSINKDNIVKITPKPSIANDQLITKYQNLCFDYSASASAELVEANYVKGQVAIGFNWDLSLKDAVKFLNENSLNTVEWDGKRKPLGIDIRWNPEFEGGQTITVEEVNQFLSQIRKESYISKVEVSTYWHSWPISNIDYKLEYVEEIDRWGYFVITFSDISNKDKFLQKYKQATYVSNGEPGGIFFRKVNPNKITVLYKANIVMGILDSIKQSIDRGDSIKIPSHTQTVLDYSGGEKYETTVDYEEYPLIYLSNLRNQENTSYISSLSVHFPSDYTPQKILSELSKHTEIDINKIKVPVYGESEWVLIKVPEDDELCWVELLKNEPEIKYSSLVSEDIYEQIY